MAINKEIDLRFVIGYTPLEFRDTLQMLADGKVNAEQAERLLARLDDPAKRWKYNPHDLDARAKWPEYMQAYADALRHCDSDAAPWYVVPSDRKWYRNWAVASLLAETLTDMDPRFPEPDFDVDAERARLAASKLG
jgi:hypothetical protein